MLKLTFDVYYAIKNFGFKIINRWYGIGYHHAKLSQEQEKKLLKKLYKNEKHMAGSDRWYIQYTSNIIFFGFLKIWWIQQKNIGDDFISYQRKKLLDQKAEHYDRYKKRKDRWGTEGSLPN